MKNNWRYEIDESDGHLEIVQRYGAVTRVVAEMRSCGNPTRDRPRLEQIVRLANAALEAGIEIPYDYPDMDQPARDADSES